MTRRNLFINDSIWQRLVELAEKSGASVSELIRRAIIEFLRREEGE
jgi:predicted transcriptional regulator